MSQTHIPALKDFMEIEVERLDRVVETLDAALDESFRLFAAGEGRKGAGWQYEISVGHDRPIKPSISSPPPGETKVAPSEGSEDGSTAVPLSQGTTAMVLCAILATLGHLGNGTALPFRGLRSGGGRRKLKDDYIGEGKIDLSQSTAALVANVLQNQVHSTTFGSNDPLTLTWLLELANASGYDAALKLQLDSMQPVLEKAAEEVLDRRDYSLALTSKAGFPFQVVEDNPFPRLRIEHVRKLARLLHKKEEAVDVGIGHRDDAGGDKVRSFFENKFLQHVAYSTMEDSRFDPAELTFAFEGMLQVGHQPAGDMAERFLSIMEQAQRSSAHWRPVNPIIAAANGLVLHPVSVETALSLLRCCTILDAEPRSVGITSRIVPMLERYWAWLLSRKTIIQLSGGTYGGWHSEHVNRPKTIHMWETSQVVLFIVGFQELIERYVARMGAKAARLDVDVRHVVPRPTRNGRLRKWQQASAQFEAVQSLGPSHEVYSRLGKAMVTPRIKDEEVGSDGYSALLYGPPGTGKTTVARKVAEALNWPFINVTVSDFLADGSDVEARAKAIFEVLSRQRSVVILFDEIDQLLLDRDSDLYRLQDSILQLLTPGMLPKLQKLRDAENCIFFVATNYVDRIDPAIKRRGRIDQQIAVLPLDADRRRKVVGELTLDLFAGLPEPEIRKLTEEAVHASFLLGYNDIKAVVAQASRLPQGNGSAGLAAMLRASARSMRMSGYRARLGNIEKLPQQPIGEILLMGALAIAEPGSGATIAQVEIEAFQELCGVSIGSAGRNEPEVLLPVQDGESEAIKEARESYRRAAQNEKVNPPETTIAASVPDPGAEG